MVLIGKKAVLIEPAVKIPTCLKPAFIKVAKTHMTYINNTEPLPMNPAAKHNKQPKRATTSAFSIMVSGIFCK